MESIVVVIPAYNNADTLSDALASVSMQSVSPAEVVVSDDGSTDDTADVARTWLDRLPLRIVESSHNTEPGMARHRAIEASSAGLVSMLDSDDIWLPDHLETLLTLFRRHGGIALARALQWAPGEVLALGPADRARLPAPARQLRAMYIGSYAGPDSLFERSLYDSSGGFRPGFRGCEEWDLYIRMLRSGARMHRAAQPTILRRVRAGSLTWDDRGIDDRVRVLEVARTEVAHRGEQGGIRIGLRHIRAERSLVRAYQLAGAARRAEARRAALGACRGTPRMALRGLAMMIAPSTTALLRADVRASPSKRARR